jgi:hypothetical protein
MTATIVLAVEVPVQGGDGHACARGDAVDRASAVPLLEEGREGSVDDRLALARHQARFGVVLGPGAHGSSSGLAST